MRQAALRNFMQIAVLAGLLVAPATLRADWYYDGNFPDVDWLSLETEHFIVHYYPEVEWTAKMTAKYAEIMYPKVTGLFDYPLKEKVHIIIRDMEENANGFAISSNDWVTMWTTPLYYVLRGRQEWIPDCLTHEFTHIVSMKANEWKSESAFIVLGSALVEDGTHNLDFGASVLIGFNDPYWWAEGIAEYGTHLSGFNWWTSSRDMMQRVSFLDDNYLTFDEMFTPGNKDAGFDRERGYQQGYAMGLYVMEKYGREQYAQLALNSNKKGHLVWEKNIEDVLGIDGKKLFDGFSKWMKDRYQRQVEPIRKEERLGRELMITSKAEELDVVEKLPDGRVKVEIGRRHFEDPLPADEEEAEELAEAKKKEKPKYEYWDKRRRKKSFGEKEQWFLAPKISPDGKYTAYGTRKGAVVVPVALQEWPVFSGRYLNKKRNEEAAEDTKELEGASMDGGFAFSPDSKKVIFSSIRCPDTWLPCVSVDGYYRYDLYTYEIETEEVERLTRRLRAISPTYSPDGKTIAFVHIEDGQNYLGLMPANAREVTAEGKCEIDGQEQENCIRWLIRKRDGTQLGTPSFSPDGSKIVIDMYRNRQQDVWMLNSDGSNLKPLTWDKAEDRDGKFTPDGKQILFVSDRTGIFNAYTLNLETSEVKQLTNVVGGVFTPFMTQEGNLLYGYFTSYGLRIFGHKKEDFFNKTIDAGYQVSAEEVARNLAYEEPLPEIKEQSSSYNPFIPENWHPPQGIPLFIYEREGLSIGTQVVVSDYLEKHRLIGQLLLGQESDYRLIYVNNFWYPSFIVGWVHVDFGYEFSQLMSGSDLLPGSNRSEPHFEQPLTYKNRQSVDWGIAGIDMRLNDQVNVAASYLYRYYTSKQATETKQQTFLTNNSYSVELDYNGMAATAEADINPRGRRVVFDYLFTRTGLPTKEWADVEWLGRTNPPGDNSDDYTYHELSVGYREAIPISWWNKQGEHTLEFHFRGGWQNRNVFMWDEFFGGSLHPLRYVPTQSNTQEFAGYPGFSLRGETMLVFGLSYRFPFYRHIDRKFGPFYFASLWGELSGTAGNLWGYTADYVHDKFGNIRENSESPWDPEVKRGTARREIPFFDIASSNGNYMLYDVGFSLKLKGFMFGYLPWNSYIRVAYPLNDIFGATDINNDNVYVDNYPNDYLRSEMQPKGLRISIGLGSNFD